MIYDKDKIIEQICSEIAGGLSLMAILKRPEMPSRDTFYRWIDESKDLTDKYARACRDRADHMFDEMLEIADDSTGDIEKKLIDGEYVERTNYENIQRSRLRIDTRKWALSKMIPKKYGDRIDTDITTNGKSIIQTIIVSDKNLKDGIDTELSRLANDSD